MVKVKKWVRMNRRSYRAHFHNQTKYHYYINQHGKRFTKFLLNPENYPPGSRIELPNSMFRYHEK